MQLNVHVPKDREELLSRLDRLAHDLDRTKSQVVLDAVETYLSALQAEIGRDLDDDVPVYDLGQIAELRRKDLYDEREDATISR